MARRYVQYFQLLIDQTNVMSPSSGTQSTEVLGGGGGGSSKKNGGDGILVKEDMGFKRVR